MDFKIFSRFSTNVLWEGKIECRSTASASTQMGHAIKAALAHGANLFRANLRGADLGGAYLRDADLRSADLRGADLRSANLGGADLRGAGLHGADLFCADLRDANLRGADLHGANLFRADLRDANLQDAYLRGADLRGADLHGADLGGADLQGANLRDANLGGANLGGAEAKCLRLLARITRSDGYEFFAFELEDGTIHVQAGCQSRSMASYRNHVKVDYPARGASDALTAETTDILDFIDKRFAASRQLYY
jgi:hypothetical protein